MRQWKSSIVIFVTGLFVFLAVMSSGGNPHPAHAKSDDRLLLQSITPSISLDIPGTVFIGEDMGFIVTFDNTTSVEGYGPIVDLIIPANGADGAQNTDLPLDGLTFIDATYLGVPVEKTVITFSGEGEETCIDHPYFVDASNNPVEVCGDAGDTFVSLRLPFGSFSPGQPPAVIKVSTTMSNYADLGVPLEIQARGGFQFGEDPLNNPASDNPALTLSDWVINAVTPTLLTLSKSYSGPEDETATGPNYPRRYTVTANVAPDQSMTNFFLEDVLPDNMQFVDLISTSPSNASTCSLPSTTTPGGTLRCDFGVAISGTVSMEFEFFIPLRDAEGDSVLNPDTGAFVDSCNQARGGGDWVPLDPRDSDDSGSFIIEPDGCEHTLSDQSIAIQKGVSVVGGGEVMPGKTLEYTLNVQVSDFFVFNDVIVTDTISDGQLFDESFTPRLQVNGNTYTLTSNNFDQGNFDIYCNYTGMLSAPDTACTINNSAPNDGTTTFTFRVSDEIDDQLGTDGDGRLVGGCVPTDGVGEGNDPVCDDYNAGPTTAQIVFRTVIQREFNDISPDSPGVVQGDQLGNTATVQGDVLSTDDAERLTEGSPIDDTSAGVSIGRGDVSKSFYAINGDTFIPDLLEVTPGDEVTYRVTYTMPVGDVKDLKFIDYFPLPVLRVDDPDADVTTNPDPVWTFVSTVDGGIPDPGVVKFGPSETYYTYTNIIPSLSIDAANNSLEIFYGDFFDDQEGTYVIDLLFTITVNDDPFADRLQLTNQIRIQEGSTAWGDFIDDGLIQFILTQPVVNIDKGVVWTDNATGEFDPDPPAPVVFLEPSESPRWTGTINSAILSGNPINSNLSGVDAGDLLTFAIVLENTGSSGSGAFDVVVSDTLPDGFVVPSGGINLQVYNGNQDVISYTDLGGGLLGEGIQLGDNASSGSLGNFDANSGENLAIITFDLELADNVAPGQIITNTALLEKYAGAEDAENHLDTPREDGAEVMVAEPVVEKSLIETNQVQTSGSDVAIGEILTYEVVVTIPEGESPNVTLTDTLDVGLAFVDCISVERSRTEVTTSYGAGDFNDVCADGTSESDNPRVTNGGRTITWDLGTITNPNQENDTAETLTITYDVVVLNTANNLRGRQRNNNAVWAWDDGSASDSAENVTIVEPHLQVVKTATPNTGDAADTINFSLEISHTAQSNSNAFDVNILDDLSSLPYESIFLGSTVTTDCDTITISGTVNNALIRYDIDVVQLGCEVTLEYSVVLDTTVSPDQGITNTANMNWNSLAEGEIDDPSSYTDLDCERSGDETACGTTANNYSADDSDTVTIYSTQFTKERFTTGLINDNNTVDQVVIGETIDYRVVLTVPEGTTPDLTIQDTLDEGLAFVACLNITAAEDLSSDLTDGFGSACPITPQDPAINPTVSLDAQTVTFDLGTIINSNTDDSVDETITIEYQAVVLNVANNQQDETRSNTAQPFSGDTRLTESASTEEVTIIEPVLDVGKTATIGGSSTGVPGDPVIYTIVIANDGPTDAYNIDVIDQLPQVDPPEDVRSLITDAQIANVSAPFGIDSNNFSLNGDNATGYELVTDTSFDLDVSEIVTIVVYGELLQVDPPAVSADQLIRNTVYMTWTSIPGNPGQISVYSADSTERDGSDPDGVNDYTTLDEADIRIQNISIDKDLIDLVNGAVLDGQDVRIGEKVKYRVRFTIPNDVFLEDLTFNDTLDPGLAYVACISLVAQEPTNGEGGLVSSLTDTEAFSCNNNTIAVTNAGKNLTIEFGDVQNTNLTLERVITLEYTAVVLNTTTNVRNIQLNNAVTASFFVNDTTTSLEDSALNVTINEPSLSVLKNANPTAADAGDTITFTIIVASEDGANFINAYDVIFSDTLPNGLTYVNNSFDLTPGTFEPTTGPTYDTSTGTISAVWEAFPPGETSTFTFSALVDQEVAPNQVILNEADINWTSMPGDVSDVSDYNNLSCERTGDPDDCGGEANDYADDDDATVTVGDITFSKALTATSADHTTVNDLTIGEVASFALTLTLPEGTIPSLTVRDNIPAGMAYVADSFSIDETDFSGSYVQTSISPVSDQNGANGEDLVVELTDVVVDEGAGTTDTILIVNFDVVVLNVADNQEDVSLVNSAEYQIGTNDPVTSNEVTMPIVEPELSLTKNFADTTRPPFEAGDTVSYQIVVTNNTSGLTAFDVVISDTAYVNVSNVTFRQDPDGLITGLENNTSGNKILFNIGVFPTGTTLTIDFDVILPDSLQVGETVENIAQVTWTSLPGVQPHERTGVLDDTLNDYVDEDDVSFTTDLPGILKTVSTTDARIGETVRFTMTVTSSLGTISDLTIIDTLPAGLIYAGNVASTGFDLPVPSVSSPNDGSSQVIVTWDMGASTVITNNTNTISFDAVIANVSSNQDGVVLSNAAELEYIDGNGVTRNPSDTADMPIIEPDLSVEKTVSETAPSLGGSLRYTLVISHIEDSSSVSANNVTLTDELPGQLSLVLTSARIADNPENCASGMVVTPSENTILVTIDKLPLECVVTVVYDAQLTNGSSGSTIPNDVIMTWTSMPGDDFEEQRDGTGGVNDYQDSTSAEITLTNPDLRVSKSVDPDDTYLPGGEVVYTIIVTNNGNENVLNATLVDEIPDQILRWNWTCEHAGGATGCSGSGGFIDTDFTDTYTLPVGAIITYTVTSDIASGAEGGLVNNVSVALPDGLIDPTPENNNDTVEIPDSAPITDLRAIKDVNLGIISPGTDVTYMITVHNDGPSDANGATITDAIPNQIDQWSWTCTDETGGANGCDGVVDSDQDFEDTVKLPAGASLTYRVTARVSSSASDGILNSVRIDPPEGVEDPDPDNNEDVVETPILSDSGKMIRETNQPASSGQNVLIGEIVTYEISIRIPVGSTLENLQAVDQLSEGLAFVECLEVYVSDPDAVSTDLPGGFDTVCPSDTGDPRITENGRRIAFNFGNVTNENEYQDDHWLFVSYTVAVLDVERNSNGVTLENNVVWKWNGGTLENEAMPVEVIEPLIQIEKSVNHSVAPLNATLTFTLRVSHRPDSMAPGYNLVLEDRLPFGLSFAENVQVMGTLFDDFEYDESTASLKFYWDRFELGDYSEINFDAVFVGPGPVENAANLEWKSLPDDPGQQSNYNEDSTWRDYAPTTGIEITELTIEPPILPVTGFTPGVVTHIPPRMGSSYNPLPGTWLEIPDLDLENRILFIPLTDSGWDLTWLSDNVGHLEGSTILTDVGNSVLTAHAVLPNGQKGPFSSLNSLKWGQRVILHANGLQYIYEVRMNYIVTPENHFVFRQDGYAWLTLLTCRDYDPISDTFLFRDVIRAVLIEVIE